MGVNDDQGCFYSPTKNTSNDSKPVKLCPPKKIRSPKLTNSNSETQPVKVIEKDSRKQNVDDSDDDKVKIKSGDRIINGVNADYGDHPWMVYIQMTRNGYYKINARTTPPPLA